MTQTTPLSFEEKTTINCRAQKRYDELMRKGKHGHYETMFQVIHEELEEAHDNALHAHSSPECRHRYCQSPQECLREETCFDPKDKK